MIDKYRAVTRTLIRRGGGQVNIHMFVRVSFSIKFKFINGPFPFRRNFEKNRNRQKYHHSLKEHPTFTKFAKFGCEML